MNRNSSEPCKCLSGKCASSCRFRLRVRPIIPPIRTARDSAGEATNRIVNAREIPLLHPRKFLRMVYMRARARGVHIREERPWPRKMRSPPRKRQRLRKKAPRSSSAAGRWPASRDCLFLGCLTLLPGAPQGVPGRSVFGGISASFFSALGSESLFHFPEMAC